MKSIYIWSLSLIILAFSACGDDLPERETSPIVKEGNETVFFPKDNDELYEVDPEAPMSLSIVVSRLNADKAATVPVVVLRNTENVFQIPSSVSFTAGEKETTLDILFPTAEIGSYYAFEVAINGDDYLNPYQDIGKNTFAAEVARVKWEEFGTGYYVDGTVSEFYGVDPTIAYAVKLQKATMPTKVRYRFDSPFAKLATEEDELGGWDGYPYNEPGDILPGKYTFIIDVIPNNDQSQASLVSVDMGMDWGAGMISCGQMYPDVSDDIEQYPLGTLEDNVITFPENSLYISLAGYENGAKYPAANPTYLYLTADAYKAYLDSLEEVEGEEGEEVAD